MSECYRKWWEQLFWMYFCLQGGVLWTNQSWLWCFVFLKFMTVVGFCLDDLWPLGGVYTRRTNLESYFQDIYDLLSGFDCSKAPWNFAHFGQSDLTATGQKCFRVFFHSYIWITESVCVLKLVEEEKHESPAQGRSSLRVICLVEFY